MQKIYTLFASLLLCMNAFTQNYTSYFTGNVTNITTAPQGGICMMGGATENDEAMKWFLQRAGGGDVLVLRASGSDGYNDYMYSMLGITLNSVESIVCHNAAASDEAYIQQKIQQAEAIWFAGGDQWDYVSYWRNTPIDSLVNVAIASRNIVIGGTSAGMAILGKYYFSAQNGTVTSAAALANPYTAAVTVDSARFIHNAILDSVITDTHYDNPDRRGRHTSFLARVKTDWSLNARGIACDEFTAVCMDNTGLARIYGGFPVDDDNAYFIQNNCEVSNNFPEACEPGNPLTWNHGNQALKVYAVKGTPTGSNSFNLNDWKTGSGGSWQNWWVSNGVWQSAASIAPVCSVVPVTLIDFTAVKDRRDVLLQWHTASETNSSHFNVQKSRDGLTYETIARINASGNSNTTRAYHYKDSKPAAGISYYRIQLVDADNSSRYSRIAAIHFDMESAVFIYPNPVRDGTMYIETNGSDLQKLIIVNSMGQPVLQRSFTGTPKDIDIHSLQNGVYFVQLFTTGATNAWVKKLVVE
jgi:cyanophycinase-like exopeptidase